MAEAAGLIAQPLPDVLTDRSVLRAGVRAVLGALLDCADLQDVAHLP